MASPRPLQPEQTAQSMCEKIVQLLAANGYTVDIVNNVCTPDSIVEHVIDVDFEDEKYQWNMHINMNRWNIIK